MARIHDLFIVELAEVIKGYGNNPDVEDPFRLSEFYRFYELPNIAVSRENFEKMRPVEPERKKGRWLRYGEDGYPNNEDTVFWQCDQCLEQYTGRTKRIPNFCPNCGADICEIEGWDKNEYLNLIRQLLNSIGGQNEAD